MRSPVRAIRRRGLGLISAARSTGRRGECRCWSATLARVVADGLAVFLRNGQLCRRSLVGRFTSAAFHVRLSHTPTQLTEAVVRVGSKIVRLVARTRRDRADVGDLSVRYGHHRAPGPRFRRRLYATASRDSARPNESGTHARMGRGPSLASGEVKTSATPGRSEREPMAGRRAGSRSGRASGRPAVGGWGPVWIGFYTRITQHWFPGGPSDTASSRVPGNEEAARFLLGLPAARLRSAGRRDRDGLALRVVGRERGAVSGTASLDCGVWASLGGDGRRDRCLEERLVVVRAEVPIRSHPG